MAEADERLVEVASLIDVRLRLDDRLARAETLAVQLAKTEKDLGTLAWKLAATRITASWVSGAVAGAMVVATWILFASRVAGAVGGHH